MNLKVYSACFYQTNNCNFALLTKYSICMSADQFQAPDYFFLDDLIN